MNNGKVDTKGTPKIPFVINPNSKAKTIQIGDDSQGVIEVLIRGYLSTIEAKSWQNFIIELGDLEKVPMVDLKIGAAALLLKRSIPHITFEDVETEIESTIILDKLYDLFIGEQSRWVGQQSPLESPELTQIEPTPKS